jgi:hypothetical protein
VTSVNYSPESDYISAENKSELLSTLNKLNEEPFKDQAFPANELSVLGSSLKFNPQFDKVDPSRSKMKRPSFHETAVLKGNDIDIQT